MSTIGIMCAIGALTDSQRLVNGVFEGMQCYSLLYCNGISISPISARIRSTENCQESKYKVCLHVVMLLDQWNCNTQNRSSERKCTKDQYLQCRVGCTSIGFLQWTRHPVEYVTWTRKCQPTVNSCCVLMRLNCFILRACVISVKWRRQTKRHLTHQRRYVNVHKRHYISNVSPCTHEQSRRSWNFGYSALLLQ